MTYKEQLQTKEWREKRAEILKRDNRVCFLCGKDNSLQVHHLFYFDDRKAWQYDNEFLITLCDHCHEMEHVTGRASLDMVRFVRDHIKPYRSIKEYSTVKNMGKENAKSRFGN